MGYGVIAVIYWVPSMVPGSDRTRFFSSSVFKGCFCVLQSFFPVEGGGSFLTNYGRSQKGGVL